MLLDEVADFANFRQRPPCGVRDLPLVERRRHEGARVLAADGDSPVGPQLHLHGHLLRFVPREVEAALGHDQNHLGPDLRGRVVPRGLGVDVLRCVVVEERLRHLRAPSVVVADEEDVFHAGARS